MSKCADCNQYEKDNENDNRGWCAREHKWVEWNDSPRFTNCGYED